MPEDYPASRDARPQGIELLAEWERRWGARVVYWTWTARVASGHILTTIGLLAAIALLLRSLF